jgi:hypothetical protein
MYKSAESLSQSSFIIQYPYNCSNATNSNKPFKLLFKIAFSQKISWDKLLKKLGLLVSRDILKNEKIFFMNSGDSFIIFKKIETFVE